MNTLDETRLLKDLRDQESRRLFYAEHISTALPFQIRALRKARKLTQKTLGVTTGMDQSTVSDLENPNYEYTPQIGTLKRLADAFDVPLIVRFGSWAELWDWETNLSPKRLAPLSFLDALPELERVVEKRKKRRIRRRSRFGLINGNPEALASARGLWPARVQREPRSPSLADEQTRTTTNQFGLPQQKVSGGLR